MEASFVSLGQLIKFAYDATGVLPRKRSDRAGLSDKEAKRIQKQLERLSDEEGDLEDRCGELIKMLAYEIAGTIKNKKFNLVIGETMLDLLMVYRSVVSDDGTFLPPKDSVKWFCSAYAIPRLVLSIYKHALRFNVSAEGIQMPLDADWYLPTISAGSINWPLEKTMDWIYGQAETSRVQFHCPGRWGDQSDAEVRQNFENATNWLNGKSFPSWPGLYWNFSRSMERLVAVEEPFRRVIPEGQRLGFIYSLFLARISTYVTQRLCENYGQKFLFDMVELFKKHRDRLLVDLKGLELAVQEEVKKSNAAGSEVDKIWYEISTQYWTCFAERCRECGKAVQRLVDRTGDCTLPESMVAQMSEQYGDYTVHSMLHLLSSSKEVNIPDCFPDALHKGFDLKNRASTTHSEVDAYEMYIKEKNLMGCLGWMVHWNRAAIFYNLEQDKDAFEHIAKAFELSKYSAGKNQYKIVNQYIELAAKNNSWKSFEKGVAWATFLDIPVRWLRSDEQTEKNMRGVFKLMKKARYTNF